MLRTPRGAREAFENARDLFLAQGNALPASQIEQFLLPMGLQQK
jgi:hypothetical protein